MYQNWRRQSAQRGGHYSCPALSLSWLIPTQTQEASRMDKDVRDEFEKQGSHGLALEQLLFALMSEIQRSHLLAEAALCPAGRHLPEMAHWVGRHPSAQRPHVQL